MKKLIEIIQEATAPAIRQLVKERYGSVNHTYIVGMDQQVIIIQDNDEKYKHEIVREHPLTNNVGDDIVDIIEYFKNTMLPQKMTMDEFNEQFAIEANIQTVQAMTLDNNGVDPILEPGEIKDPYAIDDYTVYDRKTTAQVFYYEGDSQEHFLNELYEHFNIKH